MLFFPFTHIVLPILRALWQLFRHTVVIPALMVMRITLFGFIYLPLKPVLNVAQVRYDTDSPVELSLYRLALHLAPHIGFFLVHLLHYVMVSVIVGTFVGMIAGFNMSLVSKIFTLSEEKSQGKVSRFTQTTPHLQRLEARAKRASSRAEQSEPKVQAGKPKVAPLSSLVQNAPKVKIEEISPLEAYSRSFSGRLEQELYEDDDGYNYMAYEQNELPSRVQTIPEEDDDLDAPKHRLLKIEDVFLETPDEEEEQEQEEEQEEQEEEEEEEEEEQEEEEQDETDKETDEGFVSDNEAEQSALAKESFAPKGVKGKKEASVDEPQEGETTIDQEVNAGGVSESTSKERAKQEKPGTSVEQAKVKGLKNDAVESSGDQEAEVIDALGLPGGHNLSTMSSNYTEFSMDTTFSHYDVETLHSTVSREGSRKRPRHVSD